MTNSTWRGLVGRGLVGAAALLCAAAAADARDIPALSSSVHFFGNGTSSDYAVWRPTSGVWYAIDGKGNSLSQQWGENGDVLVPGDYDGDGKTDVAVWRPSTGTWYIVQSSNGQLVSKQWGASTDIPVVGDFDGDGKTDMACGGPRPASGTSFKAATASCSPSSGVRLPIFRWWGILMATARPILQCGDPQTVPGTSSKAATASR